MNGIAVFIKVLVNLFPTQWQYLFSICFSSNAIMSRLTRQYTVPQPSCSFRFRRPVHFKSSCVCTFYIYATETKNNLSTSEYTYIYQQWLHMGLWAINKAFQRSMPNFPFQIKSVFLWCNFIAAHSKVLEIFSPNSWPQKGVTHHIFLCRLHHFCHREKMDGDEIRLLTACSWYLGDMQTLKIFTRVTFQIWIQYQW